MRRYTCKLPHLRRHRRLETVRFASFMRTKRQERWMRRSREPFTGEQSWHWQQSGGSDILVDHLVIINKCVRPQMPVCLTNDLVYPRTYAFGEGCALYLVTVRPRKRAAPWPWLRRSCQISAFELASVTGTGRTEVVVGASVSQQKKKVPTGVTDQVKKTLRVFRSPGRHLTTWIQSSLAGTRLTAAPSCGFSASSILQPSLCTPYYLGLDSAKVGKQETSHAQDWRPPVHPASCISHVHDQRTGGSSR